MAAHGPEPTGAQPHVVMGSNGGVFLNGQKGKQVHAHAIDHRRLQKPLAESEVPDGPQRALDESTREAFSAFNQAIQAAQLDVVQQIRAQLSQLALENHVLRERLGESVRADTVLPDPDPTPTKPPCELPTLDPVETIQLSDSLVPQVCMASQPQPWTEGFMPTTVLPGELPDDLGKLPVPYMPSNRRRVSRGLSRHTLTTMIHSHRTDKDDVLKSKKNWLFPDRTELMSQVQESMVKPEYKVVNFYRTEGLAQRVARSNAMETVTLVVIGLNSIWIAIDTDHNTDPLAPAVVFIVVDNLFCAFFFVELLIRWLAFEKKRNCLRDFWFVFDFVLVIVAVLETWVMAVVGALSGASARTRLLRMARLARLARTARIVRLLRAVPEIMIMFKGMVVASHAVVCTIVLLTIIIYVFALSFRLLTMGSELGDSHFRSVPWSMRTLLLRGAVPDAGDFVADLSDSHLFLGAFGLAFVVLAMLVVLNMLAGVLVNVVLVVAELEKEQADATFVKNALPVLLDLGDLDGDTNISKSEFDQFVVNPEVAKVLRQVNVDILGLVELSDSIFADGESMLSFQDFFSLLLKLRGSNTATVKDLVEMRHFFVQENSSLESCLGGMLERVLVKLGDPTAPVLL